MKIKTNYFYPCNVVQNRNKNVNMLSSTSFCGDKNSQSNVARVFAPYVLSSMFLLGGLNSCSIGRQTGRDTSKDFIVEYYNVKRGTREHLASCVENFKSKLDADNKFLDGITLIITEDFSKLEEDYSIKSFLKTNKNLKNAGGISFYSDKNIPSVIVIQEYPHTLNDDIVNLSQVSEKSINPYLRHSLMHEVGHQFDEYFGHNHDDKFAKDFDSLMYIKEQNPTENPYVYAYKNAKEKDIITKYSKNNGLSDSDEFKKALLQDLSRVAELKRTAPGYLPENIGYYTKDIDFSNNITAESVENADMSRGEIYASLFSYALGENDGEKMFFCDAFSNSYNVVIEDIKTFLGDNVLK